MEGKMRKKSRNFLFMKIFEFEKTWILAPLSQAISQFLSIMPNSNLFIKTIFLIEEKIRDHFQSLKNSLYSQEIGGKL